jgi:hypothetical protein
MKKHLKNWSKIENNFFMNKNVFNENNWVEIFFYFIFLMKFKKNPI